MSSKAKPSNIGRHDLTQWLLPAVPIAAWVALLAASVALGRFIQQSYQQVSTDFAPVLKGTIDANVLSALIVWKHSLLALAVAMLCSSTFCISSIWKHSTKKTRMWWIGATLLIGCGLGLFLAQEASLFPDPRTEVLSQAHKSGLLRHAVPIPTLLAVVWGLAGLVMTAGIAASASALTTINRAVDPNGVAVMTRWSRNLLLLGSIGPACAVAEVLAVAVLCVELSADDSQRADLLRLGRAQALGLGFMFSCLQAIAYLPVVYSLNESAHRLAGKLSDGNKSYEDVLQACGHGRDDGGVVGTISRGLAVVSPVLLALIADQLRWPF